MKYTRALSLLAIAAVLFGCEIIDTVKDVVEVSESVETVSDYATATKHFQGVGVAGDEAILTVEGESAQLKVNGPAITVDPLDFITFPKNIVVDFGLGVTGLDGRIRKGKLNILLENGWVKETGSVRTTTFDEYYQDNYKIEGTHVVTNAGLVSSQHTFDVEVVNGKITGPLGGVITYAQSTTRTWIAGEDSPLDIFDDIYEIVGVQSGLSRNGNAYSLSIDEANPVVVDFSCQYIKSGILNVDIDGAPDMSIDYFSDSEADGVADCDAIATLTIGDQEYPIGF